METILLRKPSVRERLAGVGNSTLYDWIQRGLLVPPVKVGLRASAWPASEIEAIAAARVAGATDAEIKSLVARLVAARRGRSRAPAIAA